MADKLSHASVDDGRTHRRHLGVGGIASCHARPSRRIAFIISGVGVAAIIATAGLSIFPFMLPSSLEPNASLTVWDASSSHLTLKIMLFATAVFLPLILAYTSWVYRVLRGPVTAAFVEGNSHSVY